MITVNTGSTLQRFLNRPGRWAIAPMSVIRQMQHNSDIVYYRLREAPPPRICYELMNCYPTMGQTVAIETFNSALERFIEQNESICSFEDWMLGE